MVIRTRQQVILFALTTTAIALVTAEILNVVLYPRDVLRQNMIGTAIIVVTVAMPICLWIGQKMHENYVLSAELQKLVDRDRLTDVATRDFFFAQMDSQPDVYGVSLMVDIDRFKTVNDSFGHIAGDVVIQAVAAALRKHTRAHDIVCRFGGEEFIVFLREQSFADGFEVAERLREAVAQTLIPFEGQEISVTVSIGGSLKARIAHINSAIKEADTALYRAKTQGRNRTIFARNEKDPARMVS